jgi:hypothetical protein
VPGSAGRSSRFPYPQYSDISRRQSGSQTSPLPALYTSEAEAASPAPDMQFFSAPQDSNYDADSLLGYAAQSQTAHEAGYVGQICEVQWLRSLKHRMKIPSLVPSVESAQPSETNFYLDDDGIRLLHQDNPFHLPLESLATVLSRCYFRTAHITFPTISSEFENQLQIFHNSMQSGQPVIFSQIWYATINIVLAIGARFSHIINAEWQSNPLDEIMYISRAYQLLGLNDTVVVLSVLDLPRIQVCSNKVFVLSLLISPGRRVARFLLYGYWSCQ